MKLGDVVQLKSNKERYMTVCVVRPNDKIDVIWLDEHGESNTLSFMPKECFV